MRKKGCLADKWVPRLASGSCITAPNGLEMSSVSYTTIPPSKQETRTVPSLATKHKMGRFHSKN